MKCIFCLEERPGTDEHVFPLAIGGSLIFDRVCAGCNSDLGSRIDTAISDNFLIRNHRARLGLAGNSGKIPAIHEILLGVAKLAGTPERSIHVSFDDATGKLDLKAIPSVSDVVLADGTKARQVLVDARDIDKIPRIIKRERALHGLPPLSAEQLLLETNRCLENGSTVAVEQPSVLLNLNFDFSHLRHALLKIIYELAFLWLGEAYLEDPIATLLRMAIRNDDDEAIAQIGGHAGDFEDSSYFDVWVPDERHHLAYSTVWEDGIIIAIRIFNIHVAAVRVTKDAAKYLVGEDGRGKLRFLAIDTMSGNLHCTSMAEENARIATIVCATMQMPPVPDPL